MGGNPNPKVSAVHAGLTKTRQRPIRLDRVIRPVPARLETPLHWKKPRRIFVNSLSDLFHLDVPLDYIQQVFEVMQRAHWHQFQILTKRADRLEELSPLLPWPENIWQGVSVENADYIFRIDHLRCAGAKTKFLRLSRYWARFRI